MKDNVEMLFNNIEEQCGFNFLSKKKETSYVEARSVFFYILNKELGFKNNDISNMIKESGYLFDRTTILYSLNNFDIYYNTSDFCKKLYDSNYLFNIGKLDLINKGFIPFDEKEDSFYREDLGMVARRNGDKFYKVYINSLDSCIEKSKDFNMLFKIINK